MRAITISNKNKKLIKELFKKRKNGKLVAGFTKIAIDRSSHEDIGEVKLWCSVIKSAFEELDYKFMLNGPCKSVCSSLLLDYDYVLAAFLRVERLIFEEFKNG